MTGEPFHGLQCSREVTGQSFLLDCRAHSSSCAQGSLCPGGHAVTMLLLRPRPEPSAIYCPWHDTPRPPSPGTNTSHPLSAEGVTGLVQTHLKRLSEQGRSGNRSCFLSEEMTFSGKVPELYPHHKTLYVTKMLLNVLLTEGKLNNPNLGKTACTYSPLQRAFW